VADLGKTDSSHKSNVSGPDHTDGNWLRHTLALSPLWIAMEQGVDEKRRPYTDRPAWAKQPFRQRNMNPQDSVFRFRITGR
jgi:hypothetical protein